MLAPWKKSYDQPRQRIKKQRHYLPYSQSYGFSSCHVWMWELDPKESWALKIDAFELWCWRGLLRVPWSARISNQSILKDISPEYSLEKTDGEAEAPVLWPRDVKYWHTRKDPDAGNDWRQEGKGITEDEMVGWHHWLHGHEFDQALGVGDGQEAWHAVVHEVAKSRTWLSDWTELSWFTMLC